MVQANQKAGYFFVVGILILMVVGCSGPMNIKEDKQKYADKLDPASVQRGEVLYQNQCQLCHGESGQGDGPKAKELSQKPVNLMERGVHITRYGMRAIIDFPHYSPESLELRMKHGNDSMPTFKDRFTEQELKDITNYILTLLYP